MATIQDAIKEYERLKEAVKAGLIKDLPLPTPEQILVDMNRK